jgi:hypothetical protein
MKTRFVVLAIVVMSIASSSAFATSPYTMSAAPSGSNWVFTLTNNSSLYVVDLQLHWDSVIGSTADLLGAIANYSQTTSFVSAPAGWSEIGGVVGIATAGSGVSPSGTLSGYTVKLSGPDAPGWFSVGTCSDSVGSNYAPHTVTYAISGVPEPGSIVALFAGLAGLGFRLRRPKA